MSERTKEWSERNNKFTAYMVACDRLIHSVEEVEEIIAEVGSDPLNILDLLAKPTEPNPVSSMEIKSVPWTEPPMVETVQTVETLDIPALDQEPIVTPMAAGHQARVKKMKQQVFEKNQKVATWIYEQLMDGPLNSQEVKKRGAASGISEYSLANARNSVDDIHLSTTIGFQGPIYWYLTGQVLPTAEELEEAVKPHVADVMSAQETVVFNYLPATQAELIGKTHWRPEKVRLNLSKLSTRKVVKYNRQNGVWSKK